MEDCNDGEEITTIECSGNSESEPFGYVLVELQLFTVLFFFFISEYIIGHVKQSS